MFVIHKGDAIMVDKNGLQSRDRPDSSSLSIGGASAQMPYAPMGESEIVYPASDGKPMGETELHRDALIDALLRLKEHFKDNSAVCVSGYMMIVLCRGQPSKINLAGCVRYVWRRTQTAAHLSYLGRGQPVTSC